MVLHSVSRFAREQLQPLVRKMDEESQMDQSIIQSLFDQGVSKPFTFSRSYIRGSSDHLAHTLSLVFNYLEDFSGFFHRKLASITWYPKKS